MIFDLNLIKYLLPLLAFSTGVSAITMQQFESSMEMMRNGCAPKFKVPVELLDRLRAGDFVENNSDLKVKWKNPNLKFVVMFLLIVFILQTKKCYTRCVAQLAGTVTKKGDFSVQKALAQIPIILPPEMQETAKAALNACKEVQKSYKDSCERVFYTTKCVHDYDPATFKLP